MASQGPVLYQFHARGGKKRKTVEGWRAFQGENPLKVSFVHGYGGELVKTSGGTEPVLGRDRPWAPAAAGAHDRRSGSQKLQGHGRCFWANPGFSREPLTANTCGQIALTHLARPGDWVVVKNLKENCCTTDKQPGKPGSLPKVFILGKFTSEAADWYEPAAVSWCGFSNDGYAQGQRLAVREVEWLGCGSWAVLEREHPAVAKYLNQIGIPTVAMATKDGCVEALIKSSVRYDKSLMVRAGKHGPLSQNISFLRNTVGCQDRLGTNM
jgi:hypothetical protein